MTSEREILEFMGTNTGIRFTLAQIARRFSVFPVGLKPTIDALIDKGNIHMTIEGVTKKYYVMSPLEEQARIKQELATQFKPLSPDYMKSIRAAMEAGSNRNHDH